MIAKTITMSLLPMAVWCQYTDGVQLINRLNNFCSFDHNIFFMDSAIDIDRWFSSPGLSSGKHVVNYSPPQTVYTFDDLSHSDLNSIETFNGIRSKNQFLAVVVEHLKFENGSQLLAQIKNVRLLDVNVKVGVFFTRNLNFVIRRGAIIPLELDSWHREHFWRLSLRYCLHI